jgi:FPC/CPF motif-containing protein YcgG
MTLFLQQQIEPASGERAIRGWRADSARHLLSILRSEDQFPCFFSRNACKRGRLVWSFVDGLNPTQLSGAADDLRTYLGRACAWDGDVGTVEPLVMQFSPETVRADTLRGYHAIGWQVLQHFRDNDPANWPEEVSSDPESPFWSMCFDGVQIFVNMSAPAHIVRRSRNLGAAFTFIINPRERFDIVAGDNPRGRNIRTQIRNRILTYDHQPCSPLLGSFQAGEIEWWQYGVPDRNDETPGKCPLKMHSDRDHTSDMRKAPRNRSNA